MNNSNTGFITGPVLVVNLSELLRIKYSSTRLINNSHCIARRILNLGRLAIRIFIARWYGRRVRWVKLLSGQKITKIAGADIHQHARMNWNRKGGVLFGSSDYTSKK
jgi:hypothetical protein